MGIRPGDRIVSTLPNTPEAVIALLATTAIGAVWSACSPDFGARSILDRFQQIEPRLLFAVDGYRFGGKDFELEGGKIMIEDGFVVWCVDEDL